MSLNSQFYIYSASAGSGKTFTLTKEYLKLCLSSKDNFKFREILAITFTNKAAAEMKSRILLTLKNISENEHDKTSKGIEDLLLQELNIDRNELSNRSKRVLTTILHNYADFSIGTIDHFTHRLVRTFAADLRLNPSFDVELDEKRLLIESTDRLINKAGNSKTLTEVLNKFIQERLEEEQSWNIEQAILDVAGHLNKEKSRTFINELKELNLQDFLAIKKSIDKKWDIIKDELLNLAKSALNKLNENGIEASDLAGGTRSSIYKYFEKISSWEIGKLRPSNTILNNVSDNKWLSATGKKAGLEGTINSISTELTHIFERIQNSLDQNEEFIILAHQVRKEFYAMAVLEQVNSCLEEIKDEENIIPIGEFNHLISNEIQSQPTPYIFERLGERYKAFFIDEFQDTSVMQWQNLLPLVNNAMSQGGYCLIVGDAKQSIYRWRGGEAEQFIGLYEGHDKSNTIDVGGRIEELYSRKVNNLEFNWRSRNEVVQFNNDLYRSFSNDLITDTYKNIYASSSQVPKGDSGGYVQLEFLDEKDKDLRNQLYVEKTIQEIKQALNSGYRHKDICVLVKKNEYASMLLQSFTSKGIPAYAAGALAINKSREVKWVISVLRWYLYPEQMQNRLDLLRQSLTNEIVNIPRNEYHDYLQRGISLSNHGFVEFMEREFQFIQNIKRESYFLYDICERLLIESGIWDSDNALVNAFLNEVHDFGLKQEAVISSFLVWWDKMNENLTIDPPEDLNQVAVMTIHKSKGLEFPIVIIPFADWPLSKSNWDKDWIHFPNEMELPSGLIGYNRGAAEKLGGEYESKFNQLTEQAQFDNLNVLYVATTRAKDALIVISRKGRGNSVSDVFMKLLNHQKIEFEENKVYQWGEYPQHTKPHKPSPFVSNKPEFSPWQQKIRISSTSPIGWPFSEDDPTAWGKKVHFILSMIQYQEDIDPIIEEALLRGDIDKSDLNKVKELIDRVTDHPELKNYYQQGVEVFNERNIIIPQKGAKRPDRLVRDNDQWVVIDYKTGAKEDKHIKQVDTYASFLEDSFPIKEKILVYIGEEIDVLKWK